MRLHTVARAIALFGVLLGFVHIALTPQAYPGWTIDALWFVGTGLAIVVAAAANVVSFQATGLRSRLLMTAINLAMGIFFAAAWLVLPGPQIVVGGLLFLSLAAFSLVGHSGNKEAKQSR